MTLRPILSKKTFSVAGTGLALCMAALFTTNIPGQSSPSARASDAPGGFVLTDVAGPAGVLDPTTLGRGAVWVDFDQDGRLDLTYANDKDPKRLFHNNGDGTFTEVSAQLGFSVTNRDQTWGLVWADYDNDGDPDAFLGNGGPWGPEKNRLLRNDLNTTGQFTDVSDMAGFTEENQTWGAAWADYNNDGWLDLYASNEGRKNLYRNNGNGTFTDIAATAGVQDPLTNGHSPVWLDYDQDGRLDIFVPNFRRGLDNRLFHNNGNETFTNLAAQAGVGGPDRAFVTTVEDFNGDGWPDLFVAAWNQVGEGNPTFDPCALYVNSGNGTFVDRAKEAGVDYVGRGMGLMSNDLNNDGLPEILIGTGGPSRPLLNVLYLNESDPVTGEVKFRDISESSGLTAIGLGRTHGITFGDFDEDGDQDVFLAQGGHVPSTAEPKAVMRNDGGNNNHWLKIRTIGRLSNRDGIGASIKVITRDFTQHLIVSGGKGFSSQDSKIILAGLRQNWQADMVEITWPSGTVQTLTNVPANATLTVQEPAPAVNWQPPSGGAPLVATAWRPEPPRPRYLKLAEDEYICACCGNVIIKLGREKQ
jgi:hypothetical protein